MQLFFTLTQCVVAYLLGGCGEPKRRSRLPVSPLAVGGTALKTAASSPPRPAPWNHEGSVETNTHGQQIQRVWAKRTYLGDIKDLNEDY